MTTLLTRDQFIYGILEYRVPNELFETEIKGYSHLVIECSERYLNRSLSKPQVKEIRNRVHRYCLPILKRTYINTFFQSLNVAFRYITPGHLRKIYERHVDPSLGFLYSLSLTPDSIMIMEHDLQLTLWRIAQVYEGAVIQKTMDEIVAATPQVLEAIDLEGILLKPKRLIAC